jgi:zinc protease
VSAILLPLVAAAAALTLGCRPPPPDRTLAVSLTAQHIVGSNGVHVYTIPDPGSELVGFHVRYAAGSTADPPGKEGLAHLVEHLMFSRSLVLAGRTTTVGTRIDAIALASNAYTSFDHTHYSTIAPPQHLEELFAIETVRIAGGCDAIDQITFEREREVVRNEMRERFTGDFGHIYPVLLAKVYRDHPYARLRGGTDTSLRAITRDDVCKFIADHYVPSKARIYIVGNVRPAVVGAAAAKWLGRVPARPAPAPTSIPRLDIEPARHDVTLDVEVPHLIFAWRVPIEHPAYPLIDRVVAALEARVSFFSLTYELGSQVEATVLGGRRAPIIVLHATLPDPRDLDETIDAFEKAAAGVDLNLPKEDYSQEKVDMFDARSWTTETLLASFETLERRGAAFADLGDQSGGKRFLVEEVERIDKLEASALRELATDMLDPDKAVRLHVTPSGTTTGVRGAAGVAINHESNRWQLPTDPSEAMKPLKLPAQRRTPTVDDYRLENGMRVILAQVGDLPLVRARFLYAVGTIHEPDSLPGLATFAGAFLGRSVDEDFTREQVRSLNTRIDYQIASLSANKWGGFDQEVVEKVRSRLARDLRGPSASSRRRFELAMRSRLYGEAHPYTTHAEIDPDRLGAMNQSDLRGLIKRYYGTRNATLIVAGRFDEALVKQYIERRFGHLPGRRRTRPAPPLTRAISGPQLVAVSHAAANQLELRVAFPAPAGIDSRHPARLVLVSIMAGRLRALRETRGLSYGASTDVVPRVGPGEYAVTVRVDPSRAAEAVTALRAILAELRASPGTEELAADFVVARRLIARSLVLERNRPDLRIEQLDFAARFGLPLDYSASLAEKVAGLNVESVAALIREELGEAHQVMGLYGPGDAVAAASRAAR